MKFKEFLRKIFSIDNELTHICVTVLGIKIKLRSNRLIAIHKLNKNLHYLGGKLDNIFYNMQVLLQVQSLHKCFAPYKRLYEGKDVVLLACGPTFKDYVPIEGAIHVGVNGAVRLYDRLDYLFCTDLFKRDFPLNKEIDEYKGNNCKKFYAIIPQRRLAVLNAHMDFTDRIPQSNFYAANADPFLLEDVPANKWAVDLENEPFGDFGGSVFSALQFILYTHPKRIYLVGCDCSVGYAYETTEQFSHICKNGAFISFKNFSSRIYPNVEIISINPVGLKGIFKDEYTDSSLVKIQKEGTLGCT